MYPKAYIAFLKHAHNAIKKSQPAFLGTEAFIFEALNTFINNPYPYDKEQTSQTNSGVTFSFTSLKRNHREQNEETYNYDSFSDKIKIVFKKGTHLKSFKTLPRYNKNSDIIFILNLDNTMLDFPEMFFGEKNKIQEYAEIIYNINNNETASIKNYIVNSYKANGRAFEFYSKIDRSYDNYYKLNLLYKFLYVNTNYESKDLNSVKVKFGKNFYKDICDSNHKDKQSTYMKTKINIRQKWQKEREDAIKKQQEEQERKKEAFRKQQKRKTEEKEEQKRRNWEDTSWRTWHEKQNKQQEKSSSKTSETKQNNNAVKNNYYKLLDIPYDASIKQIKEAIRKRMMKEHPDVSTHPNATGRAKTLNLAREVLCDPFKRLKYNQKKGINANINFNSEEKEM